MLQVAKFEKIVFWMQGVIFNMDDVKFNRQFIDFFFCQVEEE